MTNKQTDRQKNRMRRTHIECKTIKPIKSRQKKTKTERQKDRHKKAERKIEWQINRQTDRQEDRTKERNTLS